VFIIVVMPFLSIAQKNCDCEIPLGARLCRVAEYAPSAEFILQTK
jgi:hypothetical protein